MRKNKNKAFKLSKRFSGIWISSELWSCNTLSAQERVFLAEIDSLDNNDRGCTASNEYFANFFGLGRRQIIYILQRLISMGLVESKTLAKRRTLKVRYSKIRELAKECMPEADEDFFGPDGEENTSDKCEHLHSESAETCTSLYIEDNKDHNKDRKDNFSVFVDYWNSKPNLPPIKSFPAERKKLLAARMREPEFAQNFKTIIDNLDASKFHTGRTASSEWVATVDWLLSSKKNYLKILEMASPSVRKKQRQQAENAAIERKKHQQRLGEVVGLSSEKLAGMRQNRNCLLYWPAIDEVLNQRKQLGQGS